MMYTLTDGRLDSVHMVHIFDANEIEDDYCLENVDTILFIGEDEVSITDVIKDKKKALEDIEKFIRKNVDDWEFCGTDETEPIRD
jgi:hypothetical protein